MGWPAKSRTRSSRRGRARGVGAARCVLARHSRRLAGQRPALRQVAIGGRVERQDEPGTGAGAKATLGLSHRELENRLGKYHPDFIGERSFEDRARSATLAVLSERAAEGRSWERVHELMTDHGLDYARHGGGARLVDRQSGDTMKAGDADRRLRLGEMEKSFGPMIDAETVARDRQAREAVRYAENIAKAARLEQDPSALLGALTARQSTFTHAELERRVAEQVMSRSSARPS